MELFHEDHVPSFNISGPWVPHTIRVALLPKPAQRLYPEPMAELGRILHVNKGSGSYYLEVGQHSYLRESCVVFPSEVLKSH